MVMVNMTDLAVIVASRVKAEIFRLLFGLRRPELHLREIVRQPAGIRSTVMPLTTDHAGGLWVGTFQDGLFYCEDGRSERVEGPPPQRQFIGYSLVVNTTAALWLSIGNGMVLRRQTEEFKAATGMSWMKFLQGYRIHRALALLSEPGHYVTEVALAAGFDSLRHFNTTFHSFMRVSPQH